MDTLALAHTYTRPLVFASVHVQCTNPSLPALLRELAAAVATLHNSLVLEHPDDKWTKERRAATPTPAIATTSAAERAKGVKCDLGAN